ncbi:MAG TPA: hypothetical protein VEP90_04150 [Methylomirabilota bacterium]|nr:hypothetical protein [Methylomirabilota bacterium]
MRRLRQGNDWCAPTCIAMLLNISRAKARLLLDENYSIHNMRNTLLNLGYTVTNWRYLETEIELKNFTNNALILYDWKSHLGWERHVIVWNAKEKMMHDPTTWTKPIQIKRYCRRWYAIVK